MEVRINRQKQELAPSCILCDLPPEDVARVQVDLHIPSDLIKSASQASTAAWDQLIPNVVKLLIKIRESSVD